MKKTAQRLRRPTVPTLATVVDRYIAEVSPTKKSLTAERSIARVWKSTRLAGRPITRIRNSDLIELRDQWGKQYAAATVVRRLAFLSHVFTVLRKDWGWTELANPVELVRRPTVADARDRRLYKHIRLRGVTEYPREELDWILQGTRSKVLPTIAIVAAETGMRRSEVCLLQRERIDLLRGFVRLVDTKNGTARNVPLTPWAKEVLRVYLVDKPLRGRIFDVRPESVTRAFIRAVQRARKSYEKVCQSLGRRPNPAYFNDLRLHDLRHEGTSELALVFEMHKLAKVNGNKDLRMLQRYYHPTGEELARELSRSTLGRRQIAKIRELKDGNDGKFASVEQLLIARQNSQRR